MERGSLRLAYASPRVSPAPRPLLWLRALLVRARILAGNLLALAGAAAALLPLLAHPRPLGRRHVPGAASSVVALPPRRRTGSPR